MADGGGFGEFLGKAGGALSAAAPGIGAVSTVIGFFTSYKARKKEARMRRARKKRALKTESRLFGAAENVVKDFAMQKGFMTEDYGQEKRGGILNYGQGMQDFKNMSGQQGFANSGAMVQKKDDIISAYGHQQDAMRLSYDRGIYGINRQEESEIRGIQDSLYELSGITGSNKSVLDMITK
tara:strand:- start:4544 stop:5086 length:543 start_codon:yes stop_codon:yes gene_type:complete